MTTTSPISVLLADDHAIVRQGLFRLITADPRFKIVAAAKNGREAVALALETRPDVCVVDLSMPLLNGTEATRQILAALPKTKVIILTAYDDDAYFERLRASGAVGFLAKHASIELLTQAMLQVVQGSTWFTDSTGKPRRQRVTAPLDRNGMARASGLLLTSRETEVLQLVAEGCANKQVAAILGISIKTVEKHRQQLMNKLGIHDTAGLTRHAVSTGVIVCTASGSV